MENETTMQPPVKKSLAIFAIREKSKESGAIWQRVGTGFVNRDGSFNMRLDCLPLDGRLHMREPGPSKELPYDAVPGARPRTSDYAPQPQLDAAGVHG